MDYDQMAAAVTATIQFVHQAGELVEIRALDCRGKGRPHSASGYYLDAEKAGRDVADLDRQYQPKGIYMTINQIPRRLRQRAPDCMVHHPEHTTSDQEVTWRNWFLVDIDPVKPAGCSATADELILAWEKVGPVRERLMQHGFGCPAMAFSGNGFHLLTKINNPNTEQVRDSLQNMLASLSDEFSDDRVKIDRAVYNAARIVRLYGTVARKGFDVAEAPHRQSHWIGV